MLTLIDGEPLKAGLLLRGPTVRLTSDKWGIWRILMMDESVKQVNLAIDQIIYLSNFVMNYNTYQYHESFGCF